MKRKYNGWAVAIAATACLHSVFALDFGFACNRENVLYKMGETSRVTVSVSDGKVPAKSGKVEWRITNFGDKVLAEGVHDIGKDGAKLTLEHKLDRVGFVRFEVREAKPGAPKPAAWKYWGVGCEPEKIQPGAPYPADFREFWQKAVADYDTRVKEGVRTIKVPELSNAKRTMYRVEVPTVHGRVVHGFYSEPKGVTAEARLPLHVQVPGAGPSEDFTAGDDKSFRLFMNVHYYRPDKPGAKHSPERTALQKSEDDAWNAKYPMRVPRYCKAGIAVSREDYFYYDVLLAISRAVDWAAMRPGVDPTRILYSGTSQGGGFGLWLCGLNRHFTRAVVFVPALTDLLGFRQDRRESGWPRLVEDQLDENRAAAERNAPYFDGVNFARSIAIPIRVLVGGADTVCPPMAGWSAFNVMPSKDKAILTIPGQGHPVSGRYYHELGGQWLSQK